MMNPLRGGSLEKFIANISTDGSFEKIECLQMYNQEIWQRHLEMAESLSDAYNPDKHYPFLLLFQKMGWLNEYDCSRYFTKHTAFVHILSTCPATEPTAILRVDNPRVPITTAQHSKSSALEQIVLYASFSLVTIGMTRRVRPSGIILEKRRRIVQATTLTISESNLLSSMQWTRNKVSPSCQISKLDQHRR